MCACGSLDLRGDELVRLFDKGCHGADQGATSETGPLEEVAQFVVMCVFSEIKAHLACQARPQSSEQRTSSVMDAPAPDP